MLVRLLAMLAVACLSACSMTPTQKKWAGFAAGVVIVGAIAAHNNTHQAPTARQPECLIDNPNHACQ
jgi:hypothetical protein